MDYLIQKISYFFTCSRFPLFRLSYSTFICPILFGVVWKNKETKCRVFYLLHSAFCCRLSLSLICVWMYRREHDMRAQLTGCTYVKKRKMPFFSPCVSPLQFLIYSVQFVSPLLVILYYLHSFLSFCFS